MDSSQGLLSHVILMVAITFPRICSLKRTYWYSNLHISTYIPKEIDSTIHKVTTKLPPKQAILVLKCHTAASLFCFLPGVGAQTESHMRANRSLSQLLCITGSHFPYQRMIAD